MKYVQQDEFKKRIARVDAGGVNTFATVYTGLQDVNTPKSQKIQGVSVHTRQSSAAIDKTKLMQQGLRSGLMQVFVLGIGLAAYIRYIGV